MRPAQTLLLALALGACSADLEPVDAPFPLSQSVVATAGSTVVPHRSWTCGMPEGIPAPEQGKPAFTASFDVRSDREVGQTQYGQRRLIELGAGSITGPSLEATLLPGGFELPLLLPNGAVELEQLLVLRGARGGYIFLRVCGTAASARDPVRVVMDIEVPSSGPYAALNQAKLVGTRVLSEDGKKLTLTVSDVTGVQASDRKIVVENPAGLRDQTWECKTLSGQKGAELYRETVTLAGSQSVGASKRGNRNIIPITGGTATGRVPGRILPLGADFQLLGGSPMIDARYVLETSDGELVIVRNCGGMGGLVPVFETRATNKYAFINEDKWLSSNPGGAAGGISITIYEKR